MKRLLLSFVFLLIFNSVNYAQNQVCVSGNCANVTNGIVAWVLDGKPVTTTPQAGTMGTGTLLVPTTDLAISSAGTHRFPLLWKLLHPRQTIMERRQNGVGLFVFRF